MSLLNIADLLEKIVQELRSAQDIDSPKGDKTIIIVPPKSVEPPVLPPSGITLSDLQRMGKSLIEDHRAEELKAMLAKMGLKSLSSAPEDRYAELYANLNNF